VWNFKRRAILWRVRGRGGGVACRYSSSYYYYNYTTSLVVSTSAAWVPNRTGVGGRSTLRDEQGVDTVDTVGATHSQSVNTHKSTRSFVGHCI
jgi:hypothetical protein